MRILDGVSHYSTLGREGASGLVAAAGLSGGDNGMSGGRSTRGYGHDHKKST